MKVAKGIIATVVVASLLWASGIAPAIIPANVPTANKQGSTGTKFLICTGAFTIGNVVSTDANGNCVDSGGVGGGSGLTVYSGVAGITISGGVTNYFPFGGGSIASVTEADVTVNLRSAATVSNFTAHLSAALGGAGANSVVFTLRKNAADTAIACTITDPAVQCSDTADSVSFATGDTIDVKAVFTGVIAVTPTFVLGAVVGATSTPAVTSVFSQTGAVNIPVTTTDIATPANPGAGTTKWYTKAGTLCSLDPSGTETCTGGGGASAIEPYLTASSKKFGPIWEVTPPVLGDFTYVNQGSSTATQAAGSSVVFYDPQHGTENIRLLAKNLPAAPYTMTAAFTPMLLASDTLSAGIALYDGTKLVVVTLSSVAASSTGARIKVVKYTNVTTFSATYVEPNAHYCQPCWLRIQDDNVNRVSFFSFDGVNYQQLHSVARTDFLTPTQGGVVVNAVSGTAGANAAMNWFHISFTQP
jgi:hypothetical protein